MRGTTRVRLIKTRSKRTNILLLCNVRTRLRLLLFAAEAPGLLRPPCAAAISAPAALFEALHELLLPIVAFFILHYIISFAPYIVKGRALKMKRSPVESRFIFSLS